MYTETDYLKSFPITRSSICPLIQASTKKFAIVTTHTKFTAAGSWSVKFLLFTGYSQKEALRHRLLASATKSPHKRR